MRKIANRRFWDAVSLRKTKGILSFLCVDLGNKWNMTNPLVRAITDEKSDTANKEFLGVRHQFHNAAGYAVPYGVCNAGADCGAYGQHCFYEHAVPAIVFHRDIFK